MVSFFISSNIKDIVKESDIDILSGDIQEKESTNFPIDILIDDYQIEVLSFKNQKIKIEADEKGLLKILQKNKKAKLRVFASDYLEFNTDHLEIIQIKKLSDTLINVVIFIKNT